MFGIADQVIDDDHKKTKSDNTFLYNGRLYTAQVKCLQTTLIKETGKTGVFQAVVQNDASDRRRLRLPNGDELETTCYLVGEYDILVTTIQPFTGNWDFIYKRNRDLTRSRFRNYTNEQREYLLATTERFTYPMYAEQGWTDNLIELLDDPELGRKI